jgi:phenylpropionate dioxygenase-like ring-hydroxylating dioxygenase large terminal subunit
MSDLGSRSRLARSRAQLPVSAYFDEALYRREQELLFARGPHYVGHELMVPEPGDFHVLPQEKSGRMLVREGEDVRLLSNVCRHHPAGPRQRREHRLSAAPLDL